MNLELSTRRKEAKEALARIVVVVFCMEDKNIYKACQWKLSLYPIRLTFA